MIVTMKLNEISMNKKFLSLTFKNSYNNVHINILFIYFQALKTIIKIKCIKSTQLV